MSDEVKDAERKIPRSMVLSVLINGVMAWVTVIVLLFCIGDPVKALESPTGYPVIEILYNATGSKVGTSVLMAMLSFTGVVAMFSALASVSRLTWAFARDRGLPFPKFFGSVHPQLRIPLNSLLLVAAVVILLQLINIGSSSALFAILSLATLALYVSYFIPILFVLLHKMRGSPIAYGPFRLGKLGYAVNIFALCFCVFIIVWLPFPPLLPVTAMNMDYAGPVFGAVLIWALFDWFVWGCKRFVLPTKQSVFVE
jgi:amino acid transporter